MHFRQLLTQANGTKAMGHVWGLLSHCGYVVQVEHLSTSCPCKMRKKKSQYSTVDTELYSSLVKAVVSSRTSSQTPGSLEEEDDHLYGPVVKANRSNVGQVPKRPKTMFPLMNDAKPVVQSEYKQGSVARIGLQRGPGKSTCASVTRILQNTMPPEQAFYLERWKKRMIAELGEEGFKEYTANVFRQGKLFHRHVEDTLTLGTPSEEEAQCPEDVAGYMESISDVLQDITEVRATESAVQHQALNYQGIVDCVALYRGSPCVIDWKTSERPKPYLHNTYDNPLQLAAYIGALNNDSNYNYQVERGLIVVAYKNGAPAHPHFMSTEQVLQYWEKWLVRMEEYKEK